MWGFVWGLAVDWTVQSSNHSNAFPFPLVGEYEVEFYYMRVRASTIYISQTTYWGNLSIRRSTFLMCTAIIQYNTVPYEFSHTIQFILTFQINEKCLKARSGFFSLFFFFLSVCYSQNSNSKHVVIHAWWSLHLCQSVTLFGAVIAVSLLCLLDAWMNQHIL